VLSNVLVRGVRIAFEIDRGSDEDQKNYDQGRDRWLLATHKIKTVRVTNREVFTEPDKVRAVVVEELSG
jgi:very-short-patch-repair endonuclease